MKPIIGELMETAIRRRYDLRIRVGSIRRAAAATAAIVDDHFLRSHHIGNGSV